MNTRTAKRNAACLGLLARNGLNQWKAIKRHRAARAGKPMATRKD